jgi:hypothetical protein
LLFACFFLFFLPFLRLCQSAGSFAFFLFFIAELFLSVPLSNYVNKSFILTFSTPQNEFHGQLQRASFAAAGSLPAAGQLQASGAGVLIRIRDRN